MVLLTSYWNYLYQKKYIRWYVVLLPILWLVIILSYGWWKDTNVIADYWAITLWSLQSILVFFMIVMSAIFMRRMYRLHNTESNINNLPEHLHLILLPIYNEPVAVIEKSIDSLVAQSLAAKKYISIVISIEEKRVDFTKVKQHFLKRYSGCFRFFYVTKHP